MFDLSSPVLAEFPFSADVLRDYALKFEIRIERVLMDLRECLREAVRDKDYCRELADTLMKDIEEMSSVRKSELNTLRAKLNRRGPASPDTEAEYV